MAVDVLDGTRGGPAGPAPGSAPTGRPRSGRTARIWEIADEITREQGRRAERGEVRARVLAEGGNGNTANTQYQRWKEHYAARPRALAPTAAGPGRGVPPQTLRVAPDGRFVIPLEIRRAMQLGADGQVSVRVDAGELRLVSQAVALRRVQARLRRYRKPGESVVDQFLAERRAMWGEE